MFDQLQETMAPPQTLGDALRRYKVQITPRKKSASVERYRILEWLRNPLADYPLYELRGADFSLYRDARLATKASPSTVRLELAIISNLYTVCIREWGMEDLRNPIRVMRLPRPAKGRNRRLLPDEEPQLLRAAEAIDPKVKPLILFAIATAMRRGEIIALRWEDVSFEKRVALLRDTKNGEARTVPLSSVALEILRPLQRKTGKVFKVSGPWVSRKFKEAADLAKLDDLHFHDMRHEATSRLFELNRFTVVEISMITGHKDLQMLKRYTHLTAMQLAARLD